MNVYEIVTSKIIKKLENGTIPWQRPWVSDGLWDGPFPANLKSKKSYRGVNLFLLDPSEYGSRWYVTKKQCLEMGGRIKREEFKNSHLVVFWKQSKYKKTLEDGSEEERNIPILRFYNIWNVVQCDGLDERIPKPPKTAKKKKKTKVEKVDAGEKVLANYAAPEIRWQGGKAFYSFTDDYIQVPKLDDFESVEGYYSTLYHEIVHSTGHESRLDRITKDPIGTETYSREELVAEMGAAFLSSYAGLESAPLIENQAAYIKSWLGRLNDDPKLVVVASARAQRAVDYIRGVTFDNGGSDA